MALDSVLSVHQNFTGEVAVVTIQHDGMGDIAGGDRIKALVKKILPNSTVSLAFVDPVLSSFEKMNISPDAKFVDKAVVKKTFPGILDEQQLCQKLSQLALIILFPMFQEDHTPLQIRTAKIPLLSLNEHGVGYTQNAREGIYHPFGIGPREIGLMFPDDLQEYYLKNRTQTPKERLDNLQNLPSTMQKAILGDSYIKDFDEKSKLYVGYAHNFLRVKDYLGALCELSPSGKYNVTVCLLGDVPEDEESDALLQKLRAPLFKNGFRSVKMVQINGDKEIVLTSLAFKEKAKGERILKIIYSKLSHDQAVALLKASQDEVLTTGDQSFLEAIALRKVPGYDLEAHKIHFVESFVIYATKKNKELGKLLHGAFFGSHEIEVLKNANEQMVLKGFQQGFGEIFSVLQQNPKMKQLWEEMIQELYEHHHCYPQLKQLIYSKIKL